MKFSRLPAICLVLFLTHFSLAQEEIVRQCNAEVAVSLVNGQVDDSKTVTATDKQIKIRLAAADFLWAFDEATGRKHFSDALTTARERYKEKGVEEKSRSGIAAKLITARDDFRFMVLNAIAKRDAAWARKLTEEVLAEFKNENEKNTARDGEADRLLTVAGNLLEVNLPAALEFARRALQFSAGSSKSRWFFFFYRLAARDQAAADAFYLEALAAKRNADIGSLLYFSGYPFGSGRIFGFTDSSVERDVSPDFVPNRNLQRQFLNLLLQKTMNLQPVTETAENSDLPEAASALTALEDLEFVIAERFPELLANVASAKAHAAALLTAKNMENINASRQRNRQFDAPFEEKLKYLEKVKPDDLDYWIVDLIYTSEAENELKRAENWLSKIQEEKVREATTNLLFHKRAEIAVKENRLADAEKLTEKIPELEFRAILLFKIAEARLKTENDKIRAAEILGKVVEAALKSPNGVERAQVLLGTAFNFEKYDSFRAADILSESVKTLNRLENPDVSISTVYRTIDGKKFGYYVGYDTPGYNLEKSFATVAKQDFQGALGQARNLDDKYLRTLAVIAVVADCAKSEPPKKPMTKKKTATRL